MIKDIKCYWDHLNLIAPFFVCYPKLFRSRLIGKDEYLETAAIVFANNKINATSENIGDLGTIIGSHYFKEKYVANLNNKLETALIKNSKD